MKNPFDIITIFGICLFLLTPIWVFTGWYRQLPESITVHADSGDEVESQDSAGSFAPLSGDGGGQFISPSPTPTTDEWIDQVWGDHADEARQVIACESSGNPKAKNPNSSASGLFQIIDGTFKHHGCTGDVFDPYTNISCAKRIFNDRGWQPWTASNACHGLVL
jgi:hypothetical protein